MEIRKLGKSESWKNGKSKNRKFGKSENWKLEIGNSENRKFGKSESWKIIKSEIWKIGNWTFGNSENRSNRKLGI